MALIPGLKHGCVLCLLIRKFILSRLHNFTMENFMVNVPKINISDHESLPLEHTMFPFEHTMLETGHNVVHG